MIIGTTNIYKIILADTEFFSIALGNSIIWGYQSPQITFGASIEVDFVGLSSYTYQITSVPSGLILEEPDYEYGDKIPYLYYPVTLSNLPFNTLIPITVTAWDGVASSDDTWSMWTSPEFAPTLTLGTPNETTIPFTLSGTAPASQEVGSGYILEKSVNGGSWSSVTPAFIAVSGNLSQNFSGLIGNTPHSFRVRSINIQPNTINGPSYSMWSDSVSASTTLPQFQFETQPTIGLFETFQFDTQPTINIYTP